MTIAFASWNYWRFQCRALLTSLRVWGTFERMRLLSRYRRGIPHEEEFSFFRHFDGSNELFVDIGANLGQAALSFRLANRTARIRSFEPNPDMEPSLRNVRKLLGDSFDFRMHGIGARTEIKTLYVPIIQGVTITQCASFRRECLEDHGIRTLFLDRLGTDRFDIIERPLPLVRFDELDLQPAFVKIDVEGAEADVIAGMEATLARTRPILMIEGGGAQAFLSERGYRAYLYAAASNHLRGARPGELACNNFYVPQERVARLEAAGAIRCHIADDSDETRAA